MLDSNRLRSLYLEFFESKGHKLIPNAPLLPERDRTVLFTTAGMHPLIPYLVGEPHPSGRRLVNVQKCLRTDDIFEIGDDTHLTFFEMLGSWSLGDYFKKDAIEWSFEFLTGKSWLDLDVAKLNVTVFAGDENVPRDEESAKIWESVGIPREQIFYLPRSDNWWGPAGETGPCGPDTEMFYDTGKQDCGPDCRPGCSCGRYFEIWNDVFMQYYKTEEGKYELLKQKNVDTGMGIERTVACLNHYPSVFEIDTFRPLMERLLEWSSPSTSSTSSIDSSSSKSRRIISDHVKASTFILAEKVTPSNVERGYVVRRLIRRAIRHGKLIGIEQEFLTELSEIVIEIYKEKYPHLEENKSFILGEIKSEEARFRNTINRGLRKFNAIVKEKKTIDGADAFLLFQSFGFPIEVTQELAQERGINLDLKSFNEEFARHQETSRLGAEKRFKGC